VKTPTTTTMRTINDILPERAMLSSGSTSCGTLLRRRKALFKRFVASFTSGAMKTQHKDARRQPLCRCIWIINT
jgi:hypothetical protein